MSAGLSADRRPVTRRQGYVIGKREIGVEGIPSRPTPLDLCSTEDHSHHLQNEAACERVFTLRPSAALVKSENGKTVAGGGSQNTERAFHFPVLNGNDSFIELNVDARGTSSSFR